MNDIEESNIRKLIIYWLAQSHPDTMGMVKPDFDKEIIYGINPDEAPYEIREIIENDYIPEFSIMMSKIIKRGL